VISIIASELITIVLLELLLGEILLEGLFIALICAGPITAWIADRQLRMRALIASQRDRLSELNLELNARNDDLDAFARAVAHDLKNPLASIIGMADLLRADPHVAAAPEARDSIQYIQESGDHALEIINGLLLLHGIRHETRDMTPIDSETAVDTALETLAGAISDSGATVTRAEALPPVRAQSSWLVAVWVNLISNAIKYGGTPPAVDIGFQAVEGGRVRFSVRDNGAGIAPSDRTRIFGEFERAASSGVEGHGLGLAIVKRVVDRLGGEIGVDDAPDGGTVFWFVVSTA
jgi:signal transduction histidine kinase